MNEQEKKLKYFGNSSCERNQIGSVVIGKSK
jgi:hypothetical protein